MHSSGMRTVRSCSRLLGRGVSASVHAGIHHRRYNKQIQQLAESCCQSPLQQWCSVTLSRLHVTRHLYTKIVLSRTF